MIGNVLELLRIVTTATARMQQIYRTRFPKSVRGGLPIVTLAVALASVGCLERPTTIDAPPSRPFAGTVLTVAVADPADAELARLIGRSWAARNGAEVRIQEAPFDGTADIALIPPADLPKWAEAGKLAEVPAARKNPADPYSWDDVLRPYVVRLTAWADRTYALPVLGEGMVLVYRKDAFDGKDGRPAAPPATWDDLAAGAAKTGLPPLPATADRLQAEFFTAAAAYDRPAVGRLGATDMLREREAFFAFQFDPKTGDPRLGTRAFAHVADLYRQMQPYRSRQPDAAAAFRSGEAKVGVLTLAELGRIGPDAAEGLGVAPLPGAGFTFDASGNRRRTERGLVNRVPYLGWGGRVGVVSASCTNAAAAWDLLADAGTPDREALELVANPRWGAGPYRTSQLEARARARWYGYGLSAGETERLISALGENLGLGVENSRVRLRTPNHADLDAALDADLRAFVSGKDQSAAEAMAKANADWKAIIDRQPRDAWLKLARKSLGF
jgi:ABC-type glycerol-3-phosphate transport system substrate-binding protein